MAAIEALPFSVRAAAVSLMVGSAASLLLDSTSALASANCSAACLAMAGNPSQIGSGTHFRRSRLQNGDKTRKVLRSNLTRAGVSQIQTQIAFSGPYGDRGAEPDNPAKH